MRKMEMVMEVMLMVVTIARIAATAMKDRKIMVAKKAMVAVKVKVKVEEMAKIVKANINKKPQIIN
jgi:hypothetical protein